MLNTVARTSEQGSRTLVHAAVGEDGEQFKGEYLSNCAVAASVLGFRRVNVRTSEFVGSEEGKEAQKRVWNEAWDILKKVAPEIENLF
jgi:retinol dehydrogenase 12